MVEKVIGIISGLFVSLIILICGEYSLPMQLLIILMIVDFISGIYLAITNKSPKTDTGGLKSSVGINGAFKKIYTLVLVAILHQVDLVFGLNNFSMNAGLTSFIIFELVSIVENAGLVGISVPSIFNQVIDILNKKNNESESDNK